MLHATFATPDLTTFCRLDELGLQAVGQRLDPERAVIECRVVEVDPWCRKCGVEGVPRDTVTRRLTHEPFGRRPTTLPVRVRRYRCEHCDRTWRQDTTKAAARRAKISLTAYAAYQSLVRVPEKRFAWGWYDALGDRRDKAVEV